MSTETSEVGCSGCLPVIIIKAFILWALIFGVSIGDKHYGVSCSCDRGITLEVGK